MTWPCGWRPSSRAPNLVASPLSLPGRYSFLLSICYARRRVFLYNFCFRVSKSMPWCSRFPKRPRDAAGSEAGMDDGTALPKRARLNPYGKALRRERIFARLRGGWAYEEIAREERVTPRRVRQIVSEALQRRQVDDGSDHAMLQLARLEQALRLAAEAVGAGEIGAIGPYLKVLAQLDRYQGAASANQAYDEEARERLFAKINRIAARVQSSGAAKPAADAAEAPESDRIEASHSSHLDSPA